MSEGKPREVRWTWQSNDNDLRNGYMSVDGRVSLAALIEYMAELAPGVPLDQVHANWATVTWSRPATDQELADRRAAHQRWQERHNEWEQQMLARLLKKYGREG